MGAEEARLRDGAAKPGSTGLEAARRAAEGGKALEPGGRGGEARRETRRIMRDMSHVTCGFAADRC
jgi:hypothetical protein